MEEKIYIITYYDKNGKYKGTINAAFETRELAKDYAAACDNGYYKFAFVQIPYYKK